ncbi:porin [Vibrio maerlii]|uniref:porin n=1 Tax=Vibrio maerlii TaxID=2231648 RepID=UPI000E3CC89D|nr:porin [Vibrio maerlii]
MNVRPYLLCSTLLSTPAFSAIEITDNLFVSGFGSTSWVKSDNENDLLINREINDESCWDCDTTFGLQLDYYYEAFSTSLQVVKRPQDEWSSPEVEWAYIGYETDNFNFRLGRLRLPLFLLSEYYYVGHAYTTARPSDEVYNSVLGITSFDGGSIQYSTEVNDEMALSIEPFYAIQRDSDVRFNDFQEYHFDTKRMYGVSVDLEFDRGKLRTTYLESEYDMTVTLGSMTLPTFKDQDISVWTLGGMYEFEHLTLSIEGQRNRVSKSWYTNVQTTFHSLIPYVQYGEIYGEDNDKSSDSFTAGLRYNLRPSVSLNAEWQYFDTVEEGSRRGSFTTGFGQSANLYTIMLNYVF